MGSVTRRVAIGVRVGVMAGCASTRPVPGGGQAEQAEAHVQMDPLVVRAETDPLTGLDGYDAEALLEVGNRELGQGSHDRALKVYQRLLEVFPDSPLAAAARFNAGLCFEHLAEHAEALASFDRIIAEHRESAFWKDAHYRRSFALAKLGRWREVADNFWAIRQFPELNTMDELEARVGQGVGHFMEGEHASAERELMSAIRFYEDKSKQEYLPADYFVGQSRFYLGEIYARAFEALALSAPDVERKDWAEMMGKELEEKCQLLLRAQNNFIRTIRVGHTGWATAAGYRIGSLYERLYEDLMRVPVPADVTGDAKDIYVEELRERVKVLVVKAINVYEQSLAMAQRVGERNEWVERTSQSLERMKSLYLSAFQG